MKIDYLKKNYCFVLRGLKYKNFKSFTLKSDEDRLLKEELLLCVERLKV